MHTRFIYVRCAVQWLLVFSGLGEGIEHFSSTSSCNTFSLGQVFLGGRRNIVDCHSPHLMLSITVQQHISQKAVELKNLLTEKKEKGANGT